MISQYFPGTSDPTPWRSAVLSLAPFLFTGPLAAIAGYHPSWGAQQFPSLASIFLIVTAAFSYGLYAFTLLILSVLDHSVYYPTQNNALRPDWP